MSDLIKPGNNSPRLAGHRPRFEKKYYSDIGPTLFASKDRIAEENRSGPEAIFEDALALIEENFTRSNYMIANLAEGLNISVRQLQRIFRSCGSAGFRSELRKIRINHGRDYLEKSDSSIASIAHKVGYVHAAHFSQSFYREVGERPREYRERRRESISVAAAGAVSAPK